ncbi:MAG: ABC transporter ATP-binding protein [Clostridia bacterium]|nr:ABC transporter ATP-binding protein [Clostridia bacterium]
MQREAAVRMVDITKTFGSVKANNNVSLDIYKGEILSLLGENGSGKTTLMNMLSGIYYPDSGSIFVDGKPVRISSPKDAHDLHIGMIHQHFKLVDVFTAAENVKLGIRSSLKQTKKAIAEICKKYRFSVDPDKKVYEMSVSEKQTLEIVKALYRGADILILDEPTAVLTPQETDALFDVMRAMKADGKSIVIITHKLNEVLAISDRVAILRKGEYIGDIETDKADVQTLSDLMVGHSVSLNIDRPLVENKVPRLIVDHLSVKDNLGVLRLNDVAFTAYTGEILGIAGVAGSGQKELLEAVAGLIPTMSGSSMIYIDPKTGKEEDLKKYDAEQIRALGIRLAFVPEDRLGMGLVGSMNIPDNMMLRSYKEGKFGLTDRVKPKKLAEKVVEELEVAAPDLNTPVRKLSGGNVQKVLVGRELASDPSLMMAAYAVRGLDINTSYAIYHLLNDQKLKGSAVIYVGEDLDVLIELCDRIMVLCAGRITGIVDGRTANKEQIGLMMAGAEQK